MFGADDKPAFTKGDRVMVYSGNQPMGIGIVEDVYKADGHYRYTVRAMAGVDVYLASQLASYGGPL